MSTTPIRDEGGCESGTSVTCASDVPSDARGGRRIYIHEDSLRDLATQSPRTAQLVYAMLGRIAAVKVANHLIAGEGVMLHGLAPERAKAVVDALRAGWSREVTGAMHQIGAYQPGEDGRRRTLVPVLREEESIVATCFFSQFYTFATDDQSSREMFEDHNSIATIEKLKQDKVAYADLDLIKGSTLKLLDAVYVPQQRGLSIPEIDDVRADSFALVEHELAMLLERHLSSSDRLMVADATRILHDAFARGILRPAEAKVMPVAGV